MRRLIRATALACCSILMLVSFASRGHSAPRDKISPALLDLVEGDVGLPRSDVARDPRTGDALVAIETVSMAASMVDPLTAMGVRVAESADTVALAWVAPARLVEVAGLPGVLRIRRPVRAHWEAVSEGVVLTDADLMQGIGALGQGVRVGVIDSFRGYSSKLGSELPPRERVTLRSFLAGGGEGPSDHGVRVMEILNDMAPASTYFLAVIDDDIGYRNAVDWLLSNGVDVISHSGGFGLFGDQRGGGPIHGKVAEAASAGALYVASAGNSARSHWSGRFLDEDGDRFHEFATGVERLPLRVDDSEFLEIRVDLTWDDWGGNPADPRPTVDYNLCLYDSSGAEVSCSREAQDGGSGQIPFEVVSVTLPSLGSYSIGVSRRQGAPDRDLELIVIPDVDLGTFAMPASSIISPADHRSALTVGASSLVDTPRFYSSRGPTNDGRIKPDLLAPDGVTTSLGAFFGTSASAPHVAGAAAILKGFEPGLGQAQLAARLRAIARQLPGDSSAAADNLYGHGRLNANFAGLDRAAGPRSTPTPAPTPVAARGSGGGCRLVQPDSPAAPWFELACLLAVLLYGASLGRRHPGDTGRPRRA